MEKNRLISDIELQLHQGAPSDDTELDQVQIAYWIDIELGALVRQECDACLKQGKQIPPIYITRETKTLSEEATSVDDTSERMYFDLTGEVMDLWDDAGIVRVLVNTDDDIGYQFVYKVSNESLDMFNALRFGKPSDENLVWYRVGERVFIKGLATADIDYNDFVIDYVEKQDIIALADTADVRVSDLVLPVLIDRVVQRGKLQMYGTQADIDNQGTDVKKVQYHTAISTPNSQQ